MSSLDHLLATLLPAGAAASLSRRLLGSLGIGSGGSSAKSGELKALRRALGGPEPVVFDVGANVGDWSAGVLRVCPGATIHAFEPSAAHLARLRGRLADGGSVRVNGFALGAAAGEATLYKDQEITGLASMTRRDLGHLGVEMDESETIRVETLDAYAAREGIARIDYLKIDVEGHELDVLAGAEAMLASGAIGAVQFEFGGCNVDTRTFLRDFHRLFARHGFGLNRIRPNGRLAPIRRYREFDEQFATTNYLALPAGGGA